MANLIDALAEEAGKRVEEGYYKPHVEPRAYATSTQKRSLVERIIRCRQAAIISEVKPRSPSSGAFNRVEGFVEAAMAMQRGGAVGISILTEPARFGGSLELLRRVRERVGLPLLMKDIFISKAQIEAAAEVGADAVLLIQALFDRGYCELDARGMIRFAHSLSLEVLLEGHTAKELRSALQSDADVLGINNRDLRTLALDLQVTRRVLEEVDPQDRIVVAESGIASPMDVRFLRQCGCQAFLVGTAIMRAEDIEGKVREFVNAYGRS